MSAPHLPDDVRRWPRDPYQVLGIARGCDALAARKAYTALIRHYKPEQFPEQFRLIREAYDLIKHATSWMARGPDESAETNDTAPVPSPRTETETVDSLWALACAGPTAEAYRRLRERYESQPFGGELPARLYAMLLAYPELDLRHHPCDWLARGMLGEGPWGPCRELYRREIDDRPEEAMSERFARLLEAAPAPRMLLEYLCWRWEALHRLEHPGGDQIAEDLIRLAGRFEQADEETWVRVLLRAADYLAWKDSSRLDDICSRINEHVHVQTALGEELGRLDFLRELSRSWHALRQNHTGWAPLVDVLPLTWTSPIENRHRILAPCGALADQPETALATLDGLHRHAPLVVSQLGQCLVSLGYSSWDRRDQSALHALASAHLVDLTAPMGEPDYAVYRPFLLRFCVTEVFPPETMAIVLRNTGEAFASQRIWDDWPLRTVSAAHRLIWD